MSRRAFADQGSDGGGGGGAGRRRQCCMAARMTERLSAGWEGRGGAHGGNWRSGKYLAIVVRLISDKVQFCLFLL